MNKPNTPQPLTAEEEQEMKSLWTELFGDSMFACLEETTPQSKRYDELMSKKLTYMQYAYDQQVKFERYSMVRN